MSRDIPDADKIAKLPQWAQNYIYELERQRDEAIRNYRDLTDNQTESRFYELTVACLEKTETLRHYFQANSMTCEAFGLEVNIYPDPRQEEIRISFNADRVDVREALLRPNASNSISIVPLKERHEQPKSS